MNQGENKNEVFLVKETEAAPRSALKLVWLDAEQAHFIDSAGKPWYFDSDKRQWKSTTTQDLHPMAWQGAQPLANPEQTEFENPTAAILYALKIHFEARLDRYKKDSENAIFSEKLRLKIKALIPEVQVITETIESIESATDLQEKELLEKRLGDLIQETDRPASTK